MAGRARNPFRGAVELPTRTPRSPPTRRRRRATRAWEPDSEEESHPDAENRELPTTPGGRRLRGGRRGPSPRRGLALERPDHAQLEVVTRMLLRDRFPFVGPLLRRLRDQAVRLRDQAVRLRSRRFSKKTLFGLGERPPWGPRPGRLLAPAGCGSAACASSQRGHRRGICGAVLPRPAPSAPRPPVGLGARLSGLCCGRSLGGGSAVAGRGSHTRNVNARELDG